MKKVILVAVLLVLMSCDSAYSTKKFYDYDHNSDVVELVFKNSDIVQKVMYYSLNNELTFVLKTGTSSTFKHIDRKSFKQFKRSGDIDVVYNQLKGYR